MNSDKKIYEELLKYHPEFKDSKEDIKKAIHNIQEINPDIKVNQVFADKLKQKLHTIAKMQSENKKTSFSFFSFMIPVFTFWFAVFWFWYLSDDLISPDENFKHEIMPKGWAAPAMLQMKMWDNTRSLKMVGSADDQGMQEEMFDINQDESQQMETMMFDATFMDDISDDFSLYCEENQWEISTLNDQTRVCNLEKTTCLEKDFYEDICINQDK